MAAIEDQFIAEGAQIIWVLEQGAEGTPGTAEQCTEALDVLGDPTSGWCVGDGSTLPEASAFDTSPFSEGRGFDMIVRRSTMTVEYSSNHGNPVTNDNPTAEEVLDALRALNAL